MLLDCLEEDLAQAEEGARAEEGGRTEPLLRCATYLESRSGGGHGSETDPDGTWIAQVTLKASPFWVAFLESSPPPYQPPHKPPPPALSPPPPSAHWPRLIYFGLVELVALAG